GYFPIVSNHVPLPIVYDTNDWKGTIRAIRNLENDFEKVTSNKPSNAISKYAIIIGTIGHSKYIDQLAKEGKINLSDLRAKNEKFLMQVISNPLEGVEKALVIAGSDKRGSIYGIYELSKQIGVSPWYYWADVPVEKKANLYVKPGVYTHGEPAVKYRGI